VTAGASDSGIMPLEVLMNVSLKPDLAKFIDAEVRRGRYSSAEDAVNAAVARLQTDQQLSPQDVAELRAELDPAIAEAERGEFADFTAEDVIADRRRALARRRRRGA
jgi:antitoxin ParD1/3/4